MKRTKLLASIIMLTTFGGVILGTSLSSLSGVVETSAEQQITGDSFVSVDNFLYSGLGFDMQFTFETPKTEKTNTFSFIYDSGSAWDRLTNYCSMTFKTNGTVSSPIGKFFFIDDVCHFQVMFSSLKSQLNTGEGATGHETLNLMYFNSSPVTLNNVQTSIIQSDINLSPNVEIRDGLTNGLRFKSHIPTISDTSTYGHIIVPSFYVAKYKDNYIEHLNNDGREYLDIPCTPTSLANSDELYKIYGSGYSICSSIVNINSDNYFLDFCAIPYEKTSTGTYVYGNNIKAVKTSVYDECAKIKSSDKYASYSTYGKSFIDNVVYACEHHPTPKTSLGCVDAYSPYNSEQVTKGAGVSSYGTTVHLQACKSEREGAQIILNSSVYTNYYVNFEPFVCSENSYKIPTSNIKVYKQLYQNVDSNWTEYSHQKTDAYIDGLEYLDLGWYPDPILPFDVAIDNSENYFDIDNGNNNGLYFTVDIPSDTPAGYYTSNAIIKVNGQGTIVMPITLVVFDFTLPEQNHSKRAITINLSELERLESMYEDKLDTTIDGALYASAYELLADHHISGGQIPRSKWCKDDLPGYIEKAKEITLDKRQSVYFLPDIYDNMSLSISYKYTRFVSKTKTVTLTDMPIYIGKDYTYHDETTGKDISMYGYETLFTELIKASTSTMNLLEKAICYFPQADEPGDDEKDQVQNILCQNVILKAAENVLANESLFTGKPNVKESLKNISYIVTSYPRGLLKGKVIDSKTEYNATLNSITPTSTNCDLAYITGNINTDFVKDTDGTTPLYHMRGYCPGFDCFQYFKKSGTSSNKYGYEDLMSMLNNDEYTVYWYGCCMPVAPFAVNFVNAPMIRYRVNKWCQYWYGIEGEYYYMSNRASSFIDNVSTPMNEDDILAGKTIYNGIHGDGTYIYPVHHKYSSIDPSLYWLSSLRLENESEALDDYNYLYYAYELINRLPEEEREAEMDKIHACYSALGVTSGPYYNTKDHGTLYNQKQNLAKIIERLAAN